MIVNQVAPGGRNGGSGSSPSEANRHRPDDGFIYIQSCKAHSCLELDSNFELTLLCEEFAWFWEGLDLKDCVST